MSNLSRNKSTSPVSPVTEKVKKVRLRMPKSKPTHDISDEDIATDVTNADVTSLIDEYGEQNVILSAGEKGPNSEEELKIFMQSSDREATKKFIELCGDEAEIDEDGTQRCAFNMEKAECSLINGKANELLSSKQVMCFESMIRMIDENKNDKKKKDAITIIFSQRASLAQTTALTLHICR